MRFLNGTGLNRLCQRHLVLAGRLQTHYLLYHPYLAEAPRGLRVAPGAPPSTPAMALGLTDHRWTVAEPLAQPLPATVPGR